MPVLGVQSYVPFLCSLLNVFCLIHFECTCAASETNSAVLSVVVGQLATVS